MKFIKRLKNLWKLSDEYPTDEIRKKKQKKKKAIVVDMYDPLSIDLGDTK